MAALELQAYRRAEAVERNANTRARKLYKQMEGLCTNTLDEFRDTDAAVKQVIQVMQNQAASLEQAYETLRVALDASREKLATMNDLLCTEDNID
jgi:predicted transcriptional regulator